MSNKDGVLDVHVPTLTPADENPTRTSRMILISRLEEEIKKSSEQCKSSEQITKIQSIPQIMLQRRFQQRKCGKDYYRPRVMTIGPIYLENEGGELGKELKLKLAAQFIKNSSKTSEELLVIIDNEMETLLTCFDDEVLRSFSRSPHSCHIHPLAATMLLDGCSILQFIYIRVWGKLKEFQINHVEASLIEDDLFLMENQIPFRVLELLMNNLAKGYSTVLQQSIDFFIQMNLATPENFIKGSYLDFYQGKHPVHLLDILRSGLLYAFDRTNISSSSDCISWDPNSNNEHKREYFGNIRKLKAAGIKLKSSGISCLGDVTFTSFGWFRARLRIPPLIIDDSTWRKLWNLVAYEMCSENCNSDYGVTSYLSFLESLIDSEEDVQELRFARILQIHLSRDKKVTELFNEIVVNAEPYREVKQKIQMHFDSWWAISIAQFLQKCFRNPWTFIAVLSAILVLVLTAIKTHFSIHPASK